MPVALENTVDDVALVFEGGGMRGAYTAAVVSTLIDEGLHFPHVSGISAGSSHVVNYVSRDSDRARATFVDIAADPRCGGWHYWRAGKGLFNVEFLYDEVVRPGGPLPFDLETFRASPATVRIGSFNATAGRPEWFTREDMPDVYSMAQRVRASSTLPMLMPPVELDGSVYFDGALGFNGGIALDAPMRDGYKKFVVVMTRARDYVKTRERAWLEETVRTRFRKYPAMVDGVINRAARYNAVRARLLEMEARGQAWLFFPENITIPNTEMSVERLQDAYDSGMEQMQRSLPSLKKFLGV